MLLWLCFVVMHFANVHIQLRAEAESTIFAKIVKGEIPCKKIYEGM